MTGPSKIAVKICGITNEADARMAIDSGADALGFNLWAGSKRHVRLEDILPWLAALPASVQKAAVMVNPSADEIRAARPHFEILQLHGQETPDLCAEAAQAESGGKVWKALPMLPGLDPSPYYQVDAILLDAAVPGAFGGTGSLIDLDMAAGLVRSLAGREIWLSGGLNPENVAKAIATARPRGVDVASGVEVTSNPRRKDRERLAAFVSAARNSGGNQG